MAALPCRGFRRRLECPTQKQGDGPRQVNKLTQDARQAVESLRYSTTAAGKILGIGNTLGLSKGLNENGPGTYDSIGTFSSLADLRAWNRADHP